MEVKYGTSARISKPALAVALNPFSLVLPAAYARAPLGLFFFIFDRIHSHLDVNLKAAKELNFLMNCKTGRAGDARPARWDARAEAAGPGAGRRNEAGAVARGPLPAPRAAGGQPREGAPPEADREPGQTQAAAAAAEPRAVVRVVVRDAS